MSDQVYKPSAKQAKAIKMIKDLLNVKYEGKTFEDCSAFLDKYMSDAIAKLGDREPSQKQKDAIAKFERRLNITFEGKTAKEASAFIDAHFKAYRDSFKPVSKKK